MAPRAECPTVFPSRLTFSELQSYFTPATLLGDGDSIVHRSDIDPEHPTRLGSLLSHYSHLNKLTLFDLSEKKRKDLSEKLWGNLQELRQKLDPSLSHKTVSFSSITPQDSSHLIASLWHLLECQYGEDLKKIFPEKKLRGAAIVAGDSSVTPALNEFLKRFGYRDPIGFVDLDGFSVFNYFFGLNAVYENLSSDLLVHRFSGLTFDERFTSEPRTLDPFDAKLYSSRAEGFIAPPLQENYSRGETHLDYLVEEFRKRMKSSKLAPSAVPLFRIGLGGNNQIISMLENRSIDQSKVRHNAEKLDRKTNSLISEFPGLIRVFTLPHHIPHLILKEIRAEDQLYNEYGRQLTEGYTIGSWFNEKDLRSSKGIIPEKIVVSRSTYQRLEKEYEEFNQAIKEVLEPRGWIVLEADNEFAENLLNKGFSIDQLEGFERVDLLGLEDFIRADGLHPKPVTALGIALREALELAQHGIATDFDLSISPRIGKKEIVLEKWKNIIRQNPSQWFSDLRMPKQKLLKLKEGLKKINGDFQSFEKLLSDFWVYFDRFYLVNFFKIVEDDLDSLRFEEKAIEYYQALLKKSNEQISPIEEGRLQRHQWVHLIRSILKAFSEIEKREKLSALIKITEELISQKQKEYSSGVNDSKTFFKGSMASPPSWATKLFYAGIRAEVRTSISLQEKGGIGFAPGLGIEFGLRSMEIGSLIFLPFSTSLWIRPRLIGTFEMPIDLQFSLRLNSCQYASRARLSFCEGVEGSYSIQESWQAKPFLRAALHPTHTLARVFLESSYDIANKKSLLEFGFAR